MVKVKPADADRFLRHPDPAIRVLLIYGGDEGLAAERAASFAKGVTGRSDDPFAHVRFDSADLAEDPGRLADEAHAVPLFGGQRVITVRLSGNRPIQAAVETILAAPPVDSWVVIVAGELRKDSPLRRLCENHRSAVAIPCYADSDRDLDRIIDEETKDAGLTITAEARAVLRGLIGGDRLASRAEVGKLCLYAAGQGVIDVEDVGAIVGDASALAVDETVDAVILGDGATFDRSFQRLIAGGTPGSVIAGAVIRHFDFLHRARAGVEAGASPAALVGGARPPIFEKRRATVERQIALWPLARIERALENLDQAMLDSRLRGTISDEVIGHALSLIAALAANLRRR